jgi:hypothetical protein
MIDDFSGRRPFRARPLLSRSTTVTDLSTRQHDDNILGSITLVFGGVNYGTIRVKAPYAADKPIVLYVVPQNRAPGGDDALRGPLDCLITDDAGLAFDEAQ